MPVLKHKLFNIMENLGIDDFSISTERRYWLVRTMGGDYYKEYVLDGFIAIGYNEITIEDLRNLPPDYTLAKDILAEKLDIKLEIPKERSGYIISQILRFERELTIGDIIIVPGRNSHMASFGIVTSDTYEYTENAHKAEVCQFEKRRSVEWLKHSSRYDLHAELQLMFNSRHIISNVDGYGSLIDNLLNDFYIKGDKTFIVLRVRQEDELSAEDFTLVGDLMSLFNEFSEEYGLGVTSADVKMKMSVQSPGDITAFASSPEGIAVIGLIIMFIKGGTFSINWGGFDLNIKVPTMSESFAKIATALNGFLNDRSKRQIIKKLGTKLDNMEIETPQSIISIMQELGTPNKKIEDNEHKLEG